MEDPKPHAADTDAMALIAGLTPEQFAKALAQEVKPKWRTALPDKTGGRKPGSIVIGSARATGVANDAQGKKVYDITGAGLAVIALDDDERKVRTTLDEGDAALILFDRDFGHLFLFRLQADMDPHDIHPIVKGAFALVAAYSSQFEQQNQGGATRRAVQLQIVAPDLDGIVPRQLVSLVHLEQLRPSARTIGIEGGGQRSAPTVRTFRELGMGCENDRFLVEDLSNVDVASSPFGRPALKLNIEAFMSNPRARELLAEDDYFDLKQLRVMGPKLENKRQLLLQPNIIYTGDIIRHDYFSTSLRSHIWLLSFDHQIQELVVAQLDADELQRQLQSVELTSAHDRLLCELCRAGSKTRFSRPKSFMVVFRQKSLTHHAESRVAMQFVEAFDDNFNRFKAAHAAQFFEPGKQEFIELSEPKTCEYSAEHGAHLRLSLIKNSVKVEFLQSLPEASAVSDRDPASGGPAVGIRRSVAFNE